MLDRPWTPGDTEQAEDRLYRIGQENKVTSIWLQANDIDKTVDAILEAKAEVIELVLNGKRKRIARTATEKQITRTIAEMIF
jgi:SNF2 family DNA or RNA helicase